jgi:hypothetical protein
MCFGALSQNCEKLRYVCPSVWQSAWNIWAPTGRIFIKFDVRLFFGNLEKKFEVSLKYYKSDSTATVLGEVNTHFGSYFAQFFLE